MNSSKKNGFTLIELLVVMILIAVLGLFIYPTILNLYNSSKKNIFLTESKSIYKNAPWRTFAQGRQIPFWSAPKS